MVTAVLVIGIGIAERSVRNAEDARLKKVVVVVLGGILVLLLLLAGVLQFVDWSHYKGAIESVASLVTGRSVEINGDIDGRLFPNVKISGSDVVVGGRGGGHYDKPTRVGEFSLTVSFLSLIALNPRFENISVNDSMVWVVPQARKKEELYLPDIGEASFHDIEVNYYLPDKNREVSGRIDSLEIEKDGKSGLRLKGEGALRDIPVSVTGRIPNPGRLEEDADAHPFSLRVTAVDDTLALSGNVMQKDSLHFDVSYNLEGDGLGRILEQFGYRAGDVIAYSSKGKISGSPEKVIVDPLRVTLGYSYGNGAFTISRNGMNRIQGRIHFDRLRWQDIQTLMPPKEAQEKERLFSKKSIEFSLPQNLFADVELSTSRFDLPGRTDYLDAELHLLVKEGRLKFAPVVIGMGEGEAEGNLTVDTAGKILTAELRADLRTIDLSALVAPLDEKLKNLGIDDLVGGNADGFVHLAVAGNSMKQLMGSLNGQAQVAVEDGYLSSKAIEALGLDLGEFLMSTLAGDPKTAIECGIVDINANSGVLETRPVVLVTNDTNVIVRGQVNLGKETIDLTLYPRAKDFSVLSGGVPVHITGDLSDLEVRPDQELAAKAGLGALLGVVLGPLAVPLAFMEPGTGKEGLCSQYIAKLREIEEKAEPS